MLQILQKIRRRTPLGWLQLSHDKGRLAVAIAGIAFADILMFMQLGFQASLYDSNTRVNRHMQGDIILISPKALNLQNTSSFARRRLLQAQDVPGVVSANALYISNLTWKNPQTKLTATVQVFGFDPDQPAFDLPEVNQQLHKLKIADTILFDRGARGTYDEAIAAVDAGEVVQTEAEKRTLNIVGIFELGASFGADASLMTSDQTFLRIFRRREAGSVNIGLLEIDPDYDVDAVAEQLRDYLPEDVKVFTKAEYVTFEENYWRVASPVGFVFGLGTAMAFIVGVVIVYQVLSTDVNAHLQEYATFKAMGYQNTYLLTVVFEEAIILALLGFIPGALLPIGLYQVAANATALPIYMTLSRARSVLTLTVVMCMISGAIATRRLQSADPADMF
ncbi:ABC transporter permease DevC [[Limnothrix rosea] IAM M-220]|uniref:ABC transporter permease DevC n=1 Tax=[Limnothrix rosea] IAM M-220 TaxID=454133 RepID=UPI00095BCEFD|nr:ABC transporter permease DevC [[Limnothrix rosea] IAM M-220]OKH11743.1 ABC transporter [[Limnothrix rosea] IAM M-220]